MHSDTNASVMLQSQICAFVRTARDNGYTAGIAEHLDAQCILGDTGLKNRRLFRAMLKSLLCSNRQQWQAFDALFDAFWQTASAKAQASGATQSSRAEQLATGENGRKSQGPPAEADAAGDGDSDSDLQDGSREGATAYERLAGLDFQFIGNTEQQRQVECLVERLAKRLRRKACRRQKDSHRGHRLNMRKTLRSSMQYGGVPIRLIYQKPRMQQPKLLLIIDVSRSMSTYSTVFLRFARGIATVFRDSHAFAVHTKLVNITEALRKPDMLKVKHHLALISMGWSGGTKIGECLQDFNQRYGQTLNKRSLVIIVSDGLDTGEPEQLAAQLRTIKQKSKRLIWLNPLIGRTGYETKTQSMLAALPEIDLFAPAHNLQSLEALEPEFVSL